MNRNIGERISWEGVSRVISGEITGFHKYGYIVLLDNGKCVIVAEESILTPNNNGRNQKRGFESQERN